MSEVVSIYGSSSPDDFDIVIEKLEPLLTDVEVGFGSKITPTVDGVQFVVFKAEGSPYSPSILTLYDGVAGAYVRRSDLEPGYTTDQRRIKSAQNSMPVVRELVYKLYKGESATDSV